MLPYDICVALKAANFPFKEWHADNMTNQLVFDDGSAVCSPTLEELIEACGEEFQVLFKGGNDMWTASSISMIFRHGKTASEAVASLWLAITK